MSRIEQAEIGPFPEGDRVPAAADGPEYELQAIGRALDDLRPRGGVAPRTGGIARPLAGVALVVIALLAFVGWLLVGPSLPR
jgi:hypothetical protein